MSERAEQAADRQTASGARPGPGSGSGSGKDPQTGAGAASEHAKGDGRAPGFAPLENFENALLFSRWLQLPLLIGLMVALVIVEIKFAEHLIETLFNLDQITRERAILVALDLIDMVLIANLIVMVVISGYETFISSLHISDENSVPAWMRRSTAGQVKLRIAVTILLIATIHLLHAYLDPEALDREEMAFMLITQLVFIATVGAFVLFQERGEDKGARAGE